jgi:hypothetical protein
VETFITHPKEIFRLTYVLRGPPGSQPVALQKETNYRGQNLVVSQHFRQVVLSLCTKRNHFTNFTPVRLI